MIWRIHIMVSSLFSSAFCILYRIVLRIPLYLVSPFGSGSSITSVRIRIWRQALPSPKTWVFVWYLYLRSLFKFFSIFVFFSSHTVTVPAILYNRATKIHIFKITCIAVVSWFSRIKSKHVDFYPPEHPFLFTLPIPVVCTYLLNLYLRD